MLTPERGAQHCPSLNSLYGYVVGNFASLVRNEWKERAAGRSREVSKTEYLLQPAG